jgi:hypothetical protein
VQIEIEAVLNPRCIDLGDQSAGTLGTRLLCSGRSALPALRAMLMIRLGSTCC